MTKGSKNVVQSAAPKAVATSGYIGVLYNGGNASGGGEDSYQTKSRASYSDKQSGSYGRATTTEKASAGDFQWKNGTSGTRNEYKQTSTVRVGDKSGYTEVYNEQRVRNVSYNKSSGSNNLITYDNGGSGYNGYGYGYGYDSD